MDEMNNASPLRQAAISAHELYSELKQAGFSRREGLELLSRILVLSMSASMDEDNNGND